MLGAVGLRGPLDAAREGSEVVAVADKHTLAEEERTARGISEYLGGGEREREEGRN